MLPESLLRYHEKVRSTVDTVVAVRTFLVLLARLKGLVLGRMLAQDKQLHNSNVGCVLLLTY